MSRKPVQPPTCPYCGRQSVKITGAELYPHLPQLGTKKFWHCAPCDAYVGCHGGTDRPLGTLANAELRKARNLAHSAFDPLWRGRGREKRTAGYKWLAGQLGVQIQDCHIGMMNMKQCRRVVEICTPYLKARKP